ncbi:MAG: heme ABC exporter ATP-binding protein CcmA [Candidatus Rokubacteria bacterium]|nr:heme ABC exporter ATP-binding protein CcmA [Candidatus Rokubacteria bacterium]
MTRQSSPPANQRAVETEGLRKAFGTNAVLGRVDLSLENGEVLALLGPNGAGKTTLLKILATLLRPSAGRGRVVGFDLMRDVEPIRAVVGLLAHGSYVYEDLTAEENLRFWATMAGLPADAGALRKVLAAVELEPVAAERARTFSSGMKRRLALARILLGAPRLQLLDEPYAGLDQQGKKWLEEVLLAFKGKGGAVILATHSFGRGLGIADRVAILAGGRIVLDRPRASLDLEELHRLYALHTENGP